VSELTSVEECNEALTYLTEAISSIQTQLSLDGVTQQSRGPLWRANTRSALAWKRHAREAVYRHRAELRKKELRAARYIQQAHPDIWADAMERA